MIRRLIRILGLLLAILVVTLTVGPYIVPLPAQPDLPPSEVARELGLDGRFVEIDGTTTFIQEAGPADGPPVVLLHGFGGSTFSWRLTLPALADAGYRATAVDLRNFGLSDKAWSADTSHAAQARFVLALMDQLGAERATIVGHSMGANVAVHLALASPERVTSLVLVDAATGNGRSGTFAGPLAGAASLLLHLPPARRLAQQVVRRVVTPDRLIEILGSAYLDPSSVGPETAAGYLAQIRTPDWDLALLAVVRDGPDNALPDPLAALGVPTLLIWGAEDPWIPLASGEAIRQAITGSTLAVVADSGHLPFEEQPASFMAELLPFLEAHR